MTPNASTRIPGYPNLVQRLRHNPDLSAGREVNIGNYFDFDYMGSAEFGSIPKAKKVLLAQMGAKGWPEPEEITEGGHTAWYVGSDAHQEMVKTWFREELASDFTGMQEGSRLKESYTAPTEESPNGWFCVDGGWRDGRQVWGLFATQNQARDFIKGLRGLR